MPAEIAPSAADGDRMLVDRLRRLAAERAHQRAFTFVDYPEPDSPGRHRTLTWSQLLVRAEAVATQLADVARPGDRAAVLLPQGLDYVAAFLGCLIARAVAVPLFPPDLPGHEDRIAAVLEDCEPVCALVTPERARTARSSASAAQLAGMPLVPVDVANAESTAAVEPMATTNPAPDDVAYLQYTSGSTRVPTGVMISHRNVVANALQGIAAFGVREGEATAVAWLPLFHDMGLVLSIATPLVAGVASVLMDPVAFLERPERWLRLLGQYDNRYLWMKLKRVIGSHRANYQESVEANRLLELGLIVPALSRVHPLGQVAEATRSVQLNEHAGKVGVLCLAAREGLGVQDHRLREQIGESRLHLFRNHANASATLNSIGRDAELIGSAAR